MSGDTLVVLLGDDIAGTLTRQRDGRVRFEYDAAYRVRLDATPLSLSMPVEVAVHPDRIVTPWLWGLLPENDAVLHRWAREMHASASSPFSLLGTPIGEDCAGAVRVCRPERVDHALKRSTAVDWLTDHDVAQNLRTLRRDSTAWLGAPFTGQFSLAGAQAKTALFHDGKRWGIPSGRTPTTHIVKPAIAGLDDHDLNEHLCLAAAARAGIPVVATRVVRFGDERAVVVERFDRRAVDGELTRVHQEDLVQTLGLHPSKKYQAEGGPSPGDVAGLFRRVMPPSKADVAVRRFADALAWNWVIAGTDAHAKNYSLLLQGRDVALAPLYDVASGLPYGDELSLHLAMKVGGEYRIKGHRRQHWEKAARELRLDAGYLLARVHELATVAPDAFADAAATPDVTDVGSALPARLVDAVAGRAARCASMFDASS